MKRTIFFAALAALPLFAADCSQLPDMSQLKSLVTKAPHDGGDEGGFFHGTREWAVVVNRQGQVCVVTSNQSDSNQLWPGSLAIAKAKAYTANAFSIDSKPMSTARLYTLTQPGHSLWGIAASNPFVATDLVAPSQGPGTPGNIEGGMISFGGGVALYKDGKVIGALGVSGDTACTDHETAKRSRHLANLDPPGGPKVDDILYPTVDGPGVFDHPLCENTYRDGQFLGNEAPSDFDMYQPKNMPPTPPSENQKKQQKKAGGPER